MHANTSLPLRDRTPYNENIMTPQAIAALFDHEYYEIIRHFFVEEKRHIQGNFEERNQSLFNK